MRTVDPELWWRSVKNPSINLSRPWKYGRQGASGIESRFRQSISLAFREWQITSSSACVKYVFDQNKSLLERWLYALFTVGCFMLMVVLLRGEGTGSEPPLTLVMTSSQLPASRVAFPAVAFCSYNLISRKRLLKYIDGLLAQDEFNLTSVESLWRNAVQIASLVTFRRATLDADFLSLLATLPATSYNITEILQLLSPGCASLVARCWWRGAAAPCSALLAARATPRGFCCVFNGRYLPEDSNTPVKRSSVVGPDRGLAVYLVEDSDDFVYLRGLADGVEVLIFDSEQFPLAEAGSIRSFTAPRNASVFCKLSATVQTMPSFAKYIPMRRRCAEYGGAESSRAHCVAACRRRAAAALCGCAPPALPPAIPADTRLCTFTDIDCLNKHRNKFLYLLPADEDATSRRELQEELSDSLDCACAPHCAATTYRAALYHAPLHHHAADKIYRDKFHSEIPIVNSTLVRIYFDSDNQVQYTVLPAYHFSQQFASLASVWVCVTGLRVAPVLELVFLCALRLTTHCLRPLTTRIGMYRGDTASLT